MKYSNYPLVQICSVRSENRWRSGILAAAIFAGLLFAGKPASAQVVLSYWDFNNTSPNYNSGTLGSFVASGGNGNGELFSTQSVGGNNSAGKYTLTSDKGVGAIYTGATMVINTPTDVGPVINGYNTVNAAQGTTLQLGFGVYAGGAGQLASDTTTNSGSFIFLIDANGNPSVTDTETFNLDSLNYSNLTFSVDDRIGAANQPTVSWQYSTNGGTSWTTLTPTSGSLVGGTFEQLNFTLPATLNNLASFQVQQLVYSANGGEGSNAIDNVELTGLAVPEPSSWALLLVGFSVLTFVIRRRGLRI